ncbi:MAG: amidohydrolase family protein [Caldilineaceae bacterium]|nr:amidohydrolase family protein [Caldilineaceae bacterium]
MTIIDAHNHPDWHGHDLPKFLANMDRFGIDKTWLLTWECPPDECNPASYFKAMHFGDGSAYPVPFEACLRYKQAAPERFVLGYAPDPRRPEAIDQLHAAIEIHGVQVCGEIKLRMLYDNPDALRMFRFCGEKGLPVTFHIDYPIPTGHRYPRTDWWYGGSIDSFERALQACPHTVFIGHAPGFWAHISGDDQYDKVGYPKGPVLPGGRLFHIFRTYPNLYADLSAGSAYTALTRDFSQLKDYPFSPDSGPTAEPFFLEFQDRLLFGRDFFDDRMQKLLNGLDLSPEVRHKIFCANAEALLA